LQNSAETWFFPRGAAATYLQLGDQLPDAVVGPALALSMAQAATLSGQQDRTIHWLDIADARITPETVVPGWHSARAMALCLRATFGLPEVDTAQSVVIARQAIELETQDGAGGHPTAHTALGAALSRDGRFDEGSAVLLDLWRRPERLSWPPWTTLLLAGALSLSLIEFGDGPACDRVLREIGPLAQTVERDHRETTAPGLASVRLAEGRRRYQEGDVEAAAVVLRRAVTLAELHPRRQLVIIGLVYLADAELARGDRAAARTALARAREIEDDEPTSAFVAGLVERAETRLGRAGTRTAVRKGALVEELTDRELSILRALQGSASQREIGAALFLSINTVKAYTKSLYRKLAVASRQDAVMTARDLGLI
jgi:LuxR family maltose regulon positive regulatory protein